MRFFLAISILLLAGCSGGKSDLAKKHLSNIEQGKITQAQEQYCIPEEELRFYALDEFKIASAAQKEDGGLQYVEVIANVKTKQNRITPQGAQPVTQVELQVWKSDDFFQHAVRSTAELNSILASIHKTTGLDAESAEAPGRSEINQSENCVFVPFNQFDPEE